ncbi:MAG: tRNA (adenosine(37)-N6)-threonylcarbamoyltransferase complex ATPase subunit type 1 TsaE [Bacteroidota bacterium]
MDPFGDLLPRTTASVDETLDLGEALAAHLQPGDVVALSGDLGSGKTHLAKGLVRGLGGDAEAVTSPTFVLVQEHAEANPPVRHLDLYRLDTDHDFDGIGLNEMLDDPDHITLVEWPERAARRFPAHTLRLRLSHEGGDRRTVAVLHDG